MITRIRFKLELKKEIKPPKLRDQIMYYAYMNITYSAVLLKQCAMLAWFSEAYYYKCEARKSELQIGITD